MRMIRFVKDINIAIGDSQRPLRERVFLIYTCLSVLSALFALAGDLIFRENPVENIVLAAVVILVPFISYCGFYGNKIDIAAKIIVSMLVFVILPAIFFFGGGIMGGGLHWIIFAFMYSGHVLTAKWRKYMLAFIVMVSLTLFALQYISPELFYEHSRSMFFIDSLISLLLVGGVCFSMTWFQNRLFMEENLRAVKEAKRAEDLTVAQNRFFSSMSHEIRTPINSILGLNELILRDADSTQEILKDASGIKGAGNMLLALINDILDFSKMEAGSMDIVPVEYNVENMLSEIVDMIWLRANDKGLKFTISVDPSVPVGLYGDEVRIKQVVVNLLNNAVKYTEKGSVELRLESSKTEDGRVNICISVSDTGMGIKKDAMPYLFDAFKRIDEEKNRLIEGTGLGLSIVKQIVDLMGGTVNVNSVYGVGTTFTVNIMQGITNAKKIGELNLQSRHTQVSREYESSFTAPTAKILIVDDNDMNLEVESKLLANTRMTIHKALSGKEALKMTLKHHYDVIIMDHLMPEMDGIECLDKIKNQPGGVNTTTPVVVLTANAGSDNRVLYNRSGFDGYLVKPVSGESLEATMLKFISPEKILLKTRILSMNEEFNTLEGYTGKMPVVITTTSMCGIPDRIVKKLRLPIISFHMVTENASFKDGVQMGADELIFYIEKGKTAVSQAPSEKEYTDFFASNLKNAHHVIHIAHARFMSEDYDVASEAARAFENVTVVSSGFVSSATGLLTLIAYKMAQQNLSVDDILHELENVKKRINCSFILDTTKYMVNKGFISSRTDFIARNLNIHPRIEIKNDRCTIVDLWIGGIKNNYKKYIRRTIPRNANPDLDVVIVNYVNIPIETLNWMKEEILKVAHFENIIFVQASAAISANCGPGCLAIVYYTRSDKSYNIASLLENKDEEADAEKSDSEYIIDKADLYVTQPAMTIDNTLDVNDTDELENQGLNREVGLKYCGSEKNYEKLLKMFTDTLHAKTEEIEGFYAKEDWKNYTIKIHAFKSSAKMIGALELMDMAGKLEEAGKNADKDYIHKHHQDLIEKSLSIERLIKV